MADVPSESGPVGTVATIEPAEEAIREHTGATAMSNHPATKIMH